MRRQRWYSRPRLTALRTGAETTPVGTRGRRQLRARHRPAEHQGRLPGRLHERHRTWYNNRPEGRTGSTTASPTSSPVSRIHLAVGQQCLGRVACDLRAGSGSTSGKLTLQGALRFDHSSSWYPQTTEGPTPIPPAGRRDSRNSRCSGYKDITPRTGSCVRHVRKRPDGGQVQRRKYLEGMGLSNNWANANPTLRMPQTTTVFALLASPVRGRTRTATSRPTATLTTPTRRTCEAAAATCVAWSPTWRSARRPIPTTSRSGALDGLGRARIHSTTATSVQQR